VVGRRLSNDRIHEVDIVEDDPHLRRLVEAGAELEMPMSRVYAFDRWGVDAILHRIEPRISYAFIMGRGFRQSTFYTERVDGLKETNEITYSVTNRIIARTGSGPDSEPVRWEAVRFLLGHAIDLRRDKTLGDVIGDLIVQAPSIFRFRAEARYSVDLGRFETAITDLSATVGPVTGAVGTRYDDPERTNFLQAALRAELTQYVVAKLATNYDMRRDTFVENQIGFDFRFQCYEFSVVFIDRHREQGRRGTEEEVRFSVNLLGVGTPIRTSVGQ
jgi:lipopolysaccharide assembly outer membrane protein LptD (OstA)